MKMKSNSIRLVTTLFLAAGLTAPTLGRAQTNSAREPAPDISYKLIPGDTLQITVPNEPQLTATDYRDLFGREDQGLAAW